MELRHLRYFVAVAETLHFSRAADRLHLTQPALSRQIRDLEEELGVRLLHRHGTTTVLTAAGARFRARAERILSDAAAAVAEARALGRQLRVGHYGTLWADFFGPALRAFARRHRHVAIEAIELTPTELVTALRRGEVDLALLGPVDERLRREFGTRRLVTVPALIALAGDHPLAKRRRLELAELAGESWIGWDERSFPGRTQLLEAAAARAGFRPRVVHSVDSVASMFVQVATRSHVAYVLPMSRKLPHGGVVFVPLRPPGIGIEMHAAWRRKAPDEARVIALAEALAQPPA
jgi:DNA-binding transcriptional LysR family regulator